VRKYIENRNSARRCFARPGAKKGQKSGGADSFIILKEGKSYWGGTREGMF
jgi:hypothetical protein